MQGGDDVKKELKTNEISIAATPVNMSTEQVHDDTLANTHTHTPPPLLNSPEDLCTTGHSGHGMFQYVQMMLNL